MFVGGARVWCCFGVSLAPVCLSLDPLRTLVFSLKKSSMCRLVVIGRVVGVVAGTCLTKIVFLGLDNVAAVASSIPVSFRSENLLFFSLLYASVVLYGLIGLGLSALVGGGLGSAGGGRAVLAKCSACFLSSGGVCHLVHFG